MGVVGCSERIEEPKANVWRHHQVELRHDFGGAMVPKHLGPEFYCVVVAHREQDSGVGCRVEHCHGTARMVLRIVGDTNAE
jgi:hypothetical protein